MAGMGGYMMVPVPTPFYRGGRGRAFRYQALSSSLCSTNQIIMLLVRLFRQFLYAQHPLLPSVWADYLGSISITTIWGQFVYLNTFATF